MALRATTLLKHTSIMSGKDCKVESLGTGSRGQLTVVVEICLVGSRSGVCTQLERSTGTNPKTTGNFAPPIACLGLSLPSYCPSVLSLIIKSPTARPKSELAPGLVVTWSQLKTLSLRQLILDVLSVSEHLGSSFVQLDASLSSPPPPPLLLLILLLPFHRYIPTVHDAYQKSHPGGRC